MKIETVLQEKLAYRKRKFTYRHLTTKQQGSDFFSNDYLGFATCGLLETTAYTANFSGAKSSRLIAGNSLLHEETEELIANYHQAETALIFNSGYDANIGLLGCIAQRKDSILYDELSHASIHDGIKLSKGKAIAFRHNDLEDLERKLATATGQIFIVTEGLFSMDGDVAPLKEIHQLAQEYKAAIIIDEAHSTGVIGEKGKGLVCELGLEKDIFARVHTFGKAMGCHGAAILGSETLRNYLINYARSFIFTTAIPPHSLLYIQAAYKALSHTSQIQLLHQNIQLFKSELSSQYQQLFLPSDSPIQSLMVQGADKTRAFAQIIQEQGFQVKPIVFPTVPLSEERIRICIHAFNTPQDIKKLAQVVIRHKTQDF